jgi:hypothetical protein
VSPEPSLHRARVPRWKIERTLADQLSDPLLETDTALVTIAVAFGTAVCADSLWEWLDDAARPLFTASGGLRDRAAALTGLITNQLCLRTCTDRYEPLLLDHLIATRFGHPLLLASVGHELARRAGWPSLTARTADRHWTVLAADGYFTPITYGEPLTLDPAHLTACCPHEITHATLTAISRHAPAELAASATRVRDSLPIAPHQHGHDQ